MALIGSLVLGFQVAGVNEIAKGVDRVSNTVAKGSARINSMNAGLGKLGLNLTMIGSAAIFTAGIRRSFQALDELGESATKAGVTVEALSALQYAARQSDTEIDALQSGLQKLNQNLGLAAKGSKTAQAAFADIGLDAMALKSMPATEAIAVIAGKIAAIVDPADRAAAAVAAFGKGGQDLLPLLSRGAEGIAALTKKANDLGLVKSTEEVLRVKEASDALKQMGDRLDAMGGKIAVSLAPGVAGLEKMLNILLAIPEAATEVGRAMGRWWHSSRIAELESSLVQMPPHLQAEFEANRATIEKEMAAYNDKLRAASAVDTAVPGVDATAAAAQIQIAALDEMIEGWRQEAIFADLSAERIALLKIEWAGVSDASMDAFMAADAFVTKLDAQREAAEGMRKLTEQTEAFGDAIKNVSESWGEQLAFGDIGERQLQIARLERQLFELQEQGGAADGANALRQQIDGLRQLDQALSAKESLDAMQKKMAEAGESIRKSIMSPLDQFQESQAELRELLSAGEIDQATFDAASVNAFQNLAATIPAVQFAGAAAAGSQEAYTTINRARAGSRDPSDVLRQIAERQLEQQTMQTAYSKAIADALANPEVTAL